MINGNHTSGEWGVSDVLFNGTYVITPKNDIKKAICFCTSNEDCSDGNMKKCFPTPQEANANAKLVSQSPSMLFFIKEYIKAFESHEISNTHSCEKDMTGYLFELASRVDTEISK